MNVSPTEETYRIPKEDITGIPPIPTQPIGFEDAEALIWFVMQISAVEKRSAIHVFANDDINNLYHSCHLSKLGGIEAPADWQGAFKCKYKLGGPGFDPGSDFNGR